MDPVDNELPHLQAEFEQVTDELDDLEKKLLAIKLDIDEKNAHLQAVAQQHEQIVQQLKLDLRTEKKRVVRQLYLIVDVIVVHKSSRKRCERMPMNLKQLSKKLRSGTRKPRRDLTPG